MTDVNLGTIFASVDLKTSPLLQSVQQVTNVVKVVKTELASMDSGNGIGKVTSNLQKMKAELGAIGEMKVGRKMGADLMAALPTISNVSAAITTLSLGAAKMAADIETKFADVRNNTTMTEADFQSMKSTVMALGKESGASLEGLADGFMHITNFGITSAEAVTVLHEAMKSAVATGSDVAGVADILAKALHEFGMKATDAAGAMNVMHLAAAQGNMTLEQFDRVAGPAMAVAANLGVSLQDASAAMSALTKHGLDAAEASVQVKDILAKIINPTKQAKDELEALSKASGIDLVRDFSQAGLQAKGLKGVIDDMARATHGNGEEIYKLIQAQEGGLGAMILAGNGAKDYKDNLLVLNDAMSGKLDPTTDGYNRKLQTFNQQVAKVTNEIKSDLLPVGQQLTTVLQDGLPVIHTLASALTGVLGIFTRLPRPLQDLILGIGALKTGTMALNLMLGSLGIETTAVTERMIALKGAVLGLGAAEGEASAAGVLAFGPSGVLMAALAGMFYLVGRTADEYDRMRKDMDAAAEAGKRYADQLAQMKAAGGSQAATAVANDLSREIDQLKTALDAAKGATTGAGADSIVQSKLAGMGFDPKNSPFINTILGVRSRLAGDMADLSRIKALQHDQVIGGAGEAKRAADKAGVGDFAHSVISHAFDEIGTPRNVASCALFVSEVFKRAGAQVPAGGISSAKGMMDWAIKQGAQAHSAKNAFPGDLIVWHGDRYGARQKGGGRSGYHVGLYLGDNKVRQSSNGVVSTMSMYDAAHASAYTVGTHATGAPAPSGKAGADQSDIDDLQARYVEATKGKYARERYEALQTYKADKATNAKEAWTVYQATLKKIHDEELSDLKKHHDKIEAQWQAHLRKLLPVQSVIEQARKRAEATAETRRQMDADLAGMDDPRSFAVQRDAARTEFARREKIIRGGYGPYSQQQNKDLADAHAILDAKLKHIDAGEQEYNSRKTTAEGARADKTAYDKYRLDPQNNRAGYQTYLTSTIAGLDAGSERAIELQRQLQDLEQPVRDVNIAIAQANRELWQRAGADMHAYYQSMRAEADDAAAELRAKGVPEDKIQEITKLRKDAYDADEKSSVAREALSDLNETFAEGTMTAAQYDEKLKALLATIDDPQLKRQVQGEERRAAKAARDANPYNYLSEGAKDAVGRSMEHFTTLKGFMRSWADDMKDIFKKLMVDFAMAQIFGSKYGGGFNFGASGAGSGQAGGIGNILGGLKGLFGGKSGASADGSTGIESFIKNPMSDSESVSGAATAAGAAGSIVGGQTGGALGQASGVLSIASMFSKGGMFAKLFAKGGLQTVFGHGLGAAMPWIGGGLLLNSLLGNPLKKIFHFSGGGFVPGTGFHDSVPAMLTPGERVLTRDQAKQGTGGNQVVMHITHNGDIHGVDGIHQVGDTLGWMLHQRLQVATTG